MAGNSIVVNGVGPHYVYHSFGPDVVVAVYDNGTMEQVSSECVIKAWYGNVEVLCPRPGNYRIVVVG